MEPKRILITRTDRLGDVVLSTPVIRFLRGKYPSAYIAFVVRPYAHGVVKNDPYLDEVIVYDKHEEHKGLVGTARFVLELRKKRFDTAIALHPANRVHLVLFLAGIRRRIGYDRKLALLLTDRVPHDKQKGLKHEVDYNLDLLSRAGIDTKGARRRPYIVTGEEERAAVEGILSRAGVRKEIIALHAGASCPSKQWPPERFAEAADRLALISGFDVVLTGGNETIEYSKTVSRNMTKKPFDMTGLLKAGELAEFLRRSRILVSNDSGPVHVAVAVGTPVVSIFGRSDPGLSPKRWGPLGPVDAVIAGDAGCDKCLAHNCEKNFKCLTAVTVDEVVDAAKNILGL